MPIYEYECARCGKFEIIQKMSDEPLSECPDCARDGIASKVKKLVSAAAFHLKGSGWYKTDYANGAQHANGAEANGKNGKQPHENGAGSSSEGASAAESKNGNGSSAQTAVTKETTGAKQGAAPMGASSTSAGNTSKTA